MSIIYVIKSATIGFEMDNWYVSYLYAMILNFKWYFVKNTTSLLCEIQYNISYQKIKKSESEIMKAFKINKDFISVACLEFKSAVVDISIMKWFVLPFVQRIKEQTTDKN